MTMFKNDDAMRVGASVDPVPSPLRPLPFGWSRAAAADDNDHPAWSEPALGVGRLLEQDIFAHRVTIDRVLSFNLASSAFAVCIPVRDEHALLPTMLTALDCALGDTREPGTLVFVVNDTLDDSIALLAEWARARRRSALVADVRFHAEIRGAPHARRLALDIGASLAPHGFLMTTDADTRVDPDWVLANLAHLRDGADLVCGTVTLDERDAEQLPALVHECGALESAYRQSLARLWQQWTGGDELPFRVQALGASLAISTSCYTAIGGLPTPVAGEDKALARLAREHGYGVIQSARARVITSGRIDGRASGGVSDALRERMTSGNPACDEALVPVALLRCRARVWNALAGLVDASSMFERRCEEDPQLSHTRMRRLDVARELEFADQLLRSGTTALDVHDLSVA